MGFKPQPAGLGSGSALRPSIVQSGFLASASLSGLTLGAAPQNGNILVALLVLGSGPAPSAGWNRLSDSGTSNVVEIFYKICGVGESATQNPSNAALTGAIAIYEIANGNPSIWTIIANSASGVSQPITLTTNNTRGIIIGQITNLTDTALPTGITGVAADGTSAGGARSIQGFHIAAPANGANLITATYAAAKSCDITAVAIY